MTMPKPLFNPDTTVVDLDKKGGVKDFDVPKDVTKK
jgi:hypothetical protein